MNKKAKAIQLLQTIKIEKSSFIDFAFINTSFCKLLIISSEVAIFTFFKFFICDMTEI